MAQAIFLTQKITLAVAPKIIRRRMESEGEKLREIEL